MRADRTRTRRRRESGGDSSGDGYPAAPTVGQCRPGDRCSPSDLGDVSRIETAAFGGDHREEDAMEKMIELLFGGINPKRRIHELVSWVFPGLMFLTAFPMEKTGMGYRQWIMTALASAVGIRVFVGYFLEGWKGNADRLSALKAFLVVVISVTSFLLCVVMREEFGWSWKAYLIAAAVMSVLAVYVIAVEAVALARKKRSQPTK